MTRRAFLASLFGAFFHHHPRHDRRKPKAPAETAEAFPYTFPITLA